MATISTDHERRQAVRVMSRILIFARQISREKMATIAKDCQEGISLYNQEELLEIQMYFGSQKAIARFREKNDALADFLQQLDNKINLILKQVRGDKLPVEAFRPQYVNISGAGVAFPSAQQYNPGDILELQLALLPDYLYIYTVSEVVSCDKVDSKGKEGAFQIAVKFVLLMDEDRESIIQHVFKQQALTLRNRRKQKDAANEDDIL